MEWKDGERQAQESTRGGAGSAGWSGTQRGQAARQPHQWPQRRFGQKPQEDAGGAAQRPGTTSRPGEEVITALSAKTQVRFGSGAIGLGACSIRFAGTRYAHSA